MCDCITKEANSDNQATSLERIEANYYSFYEQTGADMRFFPSFSLHLA